MKIIYFISVLAGLAQAASCELSITSLSNRPDLLNSTVDLLWECQGKFQAGHNYEKPTAFLTKRLNECLNDDNLPVCYLVLEDEKPIGMIRLSDTWTTDAELAPEIGSHPEWKPWIHGGVLVAPHHSAKEQKIEALLLPIIQLKALQFDYKKLYVALSDDEKQKRYEKLYGYTQFATDTFHKIPVNLLSCDFTTEPETEYAAFDADQTSI
jgi:hypothetical protein